MNAANITINCCFFPGFVVPVPAVVVALTVNRYKYRIAMFPPTICFSPDHFFYSGVLVIMTLTILSTVLLTIILWKVRKVNAAHICNLNLSDAHHLYSTTLYSKLIKVQDKLL